MPANTQWSILMDEAFLYTEMKTGGHNFSDATIAEMFDFLEGRVRWEGKGKKARRSAGPHSSFLDPVTPEELKYLGDFRNN